MVAKGSRSPARRRHRSPIGGAAEGTESERLLLEVAGGEVALGQSVGHRLAGGKMRRTEEPIPDGELHAPQGVRHAAPYNLDVATATAVAPMVAVSLAAHDAGDETLTDTTLADTIYGMAASTDPATQMLGMGLRSLWSDP